MLRSAGHEPRIIATRGGGDQTVLERRGFARPFGASRPPPPNYFVPSTTSRTRSPLRTRRRHSRGGGCRGLGRLHLHRVVNRATLARSGCASRQSGRAIERTQEAVAADEGVRASVERWLALSPPVIASGDAAATSGSTRELSRGGLVTAPITVAIVSWNTRDLLARCLGRSPDADAGVADVWVVDNGSDDGSPEIVRERSLGHLIAPGRTSASARRSTSSRSAPTRRGSRRPTPTSRCDPGALERCSRPARGIQAPARSRRGWSCPTARHSTRSSPSRRSRSPLLHAVGAFGSGRLTDR